MLGRLCAVPWIPLPTMTAALRSFAASMCVDGVASRRPLRRAIEIDYHSADRPRCLSVSRLNLQLASEVDALAYLFKRREIHHSLDVATLSLNDRNVCVI